jgi:hypothetical protein
MGSSAATAAPGAVRNGGPGLIIVRRASTRRIATALASVAALVAAVGATAAAGRDTGDKGAGAPRFADYPAGSVFRGAPAAPDFKRGPAAEAFATELREGARRGPNFAGYLRVIEWSCGTSCRRWMIVNSRNGRIHDAPEPAFSLEYQLNSRLLVVNTVGRFTAADPPAGVPIAKYYVWRNDRLELIDTRAMRGGRSSPSR